MLIIIYVNYVWLFHCKTICELSDINILVVVSIRLHVLNRTLIFTAMTTPILRYLLVFVRSLLAMTAMNGTIGLAQAGTIVWGGSVGDINVDSKGQALTSAMTFQLGIFTDRLDGDPFDPSVESFELWDDHWVAFDQSAYSVISQNGQETEFGLYTGGATLLPDLTSTSSRIPQSTPKPTFNPGAQAYIWGFNSKEIGVDSEWLLVTNDSRDGNTEDDWLLPTPSTHSPDTIQMRIPNATTSVFGALGDYRGTGDSPVIEGSGAKDQAVDSYSIQTYSFLPAVPEPSSVSLLIGSALLLVLRRRRTTV